MTSPKRETLRSLVFSELLQGPQIELYQDTDTKGLASYTETHFFGLGKGKIWG